MKHSEKPGPIDSRGPTRRPETNPDFVEADTRPSIKPEKNEPPTVELPEQIIELEMEPTETEQNIEANTPEQRAEQWANKITKDNLVAASLDASGLTREEIKEVGQKLALRDPFVFESAYEIHDFWLTDQDKNDLARQWLEKDPQTSPWMIQTLELSNEQIKRVLNSLPEDKRLEVYRALKIPGPEGAEKLLGFSFEDYGQAMDIGEPDSPEKRERKERMKKAQEVSAKLGDAIVEAFPERVGTESRRTKIEQELQESKFVRLQDIDKGETAPVAAMLEGRNLPSVLKLFRTEPGVAPGTTPLRAGIAPGGGAPREWLAHQLGRVFAPDMVPVTVFRESPLGDGTLQEWEVGQELEKIRFIREADQDPEFRRQLRRNGTFDQVVTNSDRHAGNKQVTAQRKIKDIDNGLILPQPKNNYDTLRSWAAWAVGGDEIDAEIIRPYEVFLECNQALQRVREYEAQQMETETALEEEKLTNPVKSLFKGLGKRFRKTTSTEDAEPTDRERQLAKVAEVIQEACDLALGEDSERAYNSIINNIENLSQNRQIQHSNSNWDAYDVDEKHLDQQFR